MKRLIASIALLLIISTYLLSCEKDDICADGTPTTPSLVIEFYQYDAPSVAKSVNLKFVADGSTKIDSVVGTKMKLPLRADANYTKWFLTYNQVTVGETLSNTDILQFHYQTKNTYVSRACGYKTTFTLDADTGSEENNPIDIPENDGPWIRQFEVKKYNIDDENEAHIKIYL